MSVQRIIDLSYELSPSTPVFPDYPGVEITVLETVHDLRPDHRALNSSRIAVGMHCGTHMDAPFHFYEEGRKIAAVPLDRLIGPAVLADLRRTIKNGVIEPKHFKPYRARLRKARRLVINTGWAKQWGKASYFSDHPVMTAEAAEFLVDSGVLLVGIDAPSVDRPPFPAHCRCSAMTSSSSKT